MHDAANAVHARIANHRLNLNKHIFLVIYPLLREAVSEIDARRTRLPLIIIGILLRIAARNVVNMNPTLRITGLSDPQLSGRRMHAHIAVDDRTVAYAPPLDNSDTNHSAYPSSFGSV